MISLSVLKRGIDIDQITRSRCGIVAAIALFVCDRSRQGSDQNPGDINDGLMHAFTG